jgi:DNA-binding transcriptional LysR family regulator
MELRHLRYFQAVAEELHFGIAAKKLNMAQPPLSQQIKQLETELGVKLFERTKPQIQLTPAGQEFLERIRSIFSDVETAVKETRRVARGEKGKISIGFVVSASYDLLPTVIRAYRSEYPEVDVELRELTTLEQIEALIQGHLHVGFLRTPIEEDGIEVQVLCREEFVIALPETHPASEKNVVDLNTLRNESFIMFPRQMGPHHYDEIIALFRRAGFSPRIVLEAVQMQTIINLVSSGIGLAIVPGSVTTLQRPGIVYRPLRETTWFDVAIAWRKNDENPLVQNFLSVAQLCCQREE